MGACASDPAQDPAKTVPQAPRSAIPPVLHESPRGPDHDVDVRNAGVEAQPSITRIAIAEVKQIRRAIDESDLLGGDRVALRQREARGVGHTRVDRIPRRDPRRSARETITALIGSTAASFTALVIAIVPIDRILGVALCVEPTMTRPSRRSLMRIAHGAAQRAVGPTSTPLETNWGFIVTPKRVRRVGKGPSTRRRTLRSGLISHRSVFTRMQDIASDRACERRHNRSACSETIRYHLGCFY